MGRGGKAVGAERESEQAAAFFPTFRVDFSVSIDR
jgi:hypothetical protein